MVLHQRNASTCPSHSGRFCHSLGLVLGCILWIASTALSAPLEAQQRDGMYLVRDLIDRQQPAQALELLETLSNGKSNGKKISAEGLMLRGVAKIMLGELKTGSLDLEKAVKKDPGLRDGWLNLAGLEIAEGKFEQALKLMQKAHDLDPSAPDSHLNLGAVKIMLGRRSEADKNFERYLQLDSSAEASYLVATNYGIGGHEKEALKHLQRAIEGNERNRLRARQDDRFAGLASLDYKVMLNTDFYSIPADHLHVAAAFRAPYDQRNPRLLYATMSALDTVSIDYEPEVETTARWALLWAADGLRIKIYNQESGTGVVKLSRPRQGITTAEWQRLSQELFRAIQDRLGS